MIFFIKLKLKTILVIKFININNHFILNTRIKYNLSSYKYSHFYLIQHKD